MMIAVYFNRLIALDDNQREIVRYDAPFSNSRMIIANYSVAETAFKVLIKQISGQNRAWYQKIMTLNPKLHLDIREHLADGLSGIEWRALYEAASAAQVRSVHITYQGQTLPDDRSHSH